MSDKFMSNISETLRAGVEHHAAGRLAEAEEKYRQVLRIHPRHAQAVHLLGLIAFQVGQHETAVKYLTEAIKVDAFQAPIPADLGEIYRAMGRIPEAIASYRKSLELNSEVPESQNYLGTLLETAGELTEATAHLREAVRLNPKYAEAYENLGRVLQKQGEFDAARSAFTTAIELTPTSATSFLGLGECRCAEGDWTAALDCFQRAAALQPDSPEAHYWRGQARLALGQFAEGWRDFEWRLRCTSIEQRSFPLPRWNGASLQGHRVLVHAEGSLGDTLQFIRFVPQLIERGGTPVLDVPAQMVPLLEASGFENLVRPGDPEPTCHLQAPLLSLPRILGTTLQTLPSGPYLNANPRLVAEWGQRLSELNGLKVGIAWQVEATAPHPALRSIPLVEFQPLAAIAGVRLVSLQKGEGRDQLSAVAGQFAVVDFGDTLDEAAGPLMDTAAIVAGLDLVITADTALAHLAGDLGVPVWVALSTAADWRWMQDRLDSPWYPTMRLFRQGKQEVWADVFARIAIELAALTKARAAGTS